MCGLEQSKSSIEYKYTHGLNEVCLTRYVWVRTEQVFIKIRTDTGVNRGVFNPIERLCEHIKRERQTYR